MLSLVSAAGDRTVKLGIQDTSLINVDLQRDKLLNHC